MATYTLPTPMAAQALAASSARHYPPVRMAGFSLLAAMASSKGINLTPELMEKLLQRRRDAARLTGNAGRDRKRKRELAPSPSRNLGREGVDGENERAEEKAAGRPVGATSTAPAAAEAGKQPAPVILDKASPEHLLLTLLKQRGYPDKHVSTLSAGPGEGFNNRPPTRQQIEEYDMTLTAAVRRGDLEKLRKLAKEGRRMDACNRFGESLVHLACRRSNPSLLNFLLENGGSSIRCDDIGRLPLHDVCWASEINLELLQMIVHRNPGHLLAMDKNGHSPLRYAKKQHWPMLNTFLESVAEDCWPTKKATATSGAAVSE